MKTELLVLMMVLLVGSLRIVEILWLKRNRQPGKIQARWTLFLISWGYFLVLLCTGLEFFGTTRAINVSFTLIGLIMILIRLPVKLWAARTLEKYWSPHIEIREHHPLITAGPYRYLRHPVYFVTLLDAIGIPLIANAWYALCIVSLFFAGTIITRMRMEEKALLDTLGDAYRHYQKETFALIPIRKKWLNSLFRATRVVTLKTSS